jgi:hypothetical protein
LNLRNQGADNLQFNKANKPTPLQRVKQVYTKMQKALCSVLKQKGPNGEKGMTAKRASEIFKLPVRATSKWKEHENVIMPEISLIAGWDQSIDSLAIDAPRDVSSLIGKSVKSMTDEDLLLLWEHNGDTKLKEVVTSTDKGVSRSLIFKRMPARLTITE